MPPIPVRAAGAELARRLTSALAARADAAGGAGAVGSSGPLVVVVVGPAGSGRSGVLDKHAAAVVQRVGAGVRRVDDVHRFDDERLRALVEQPGAEVLLLSWVDPRPPPRRPGRAGPAGRAG